MNYIDKLIEDRKNFLESKLKGKMETIRIYTEEIARCNKSIENIKKELFQDKNQTRIIEIEKDIIKSKQYKINYFDILWYI